MPPTDLSAGLGLPELPYGTVWLVGTGSGDPRHLSPLALHALATADVVLHDPAAPQQILDLVKPPRYREAASPEQAIERSIKLAQDGWRVVHLVESNTIEYATACGVRCAERKIPLRVVPGVGEAVGREAPLGLLLVRKSATLGRADPHSSLVLLVATPQVETAPGTQRRRPLDFSMAGLAG